MTSRKLHNQLIVNRLSLRFFGLPQGVKGSRNKGPEIVSFPLPLDPSGPLPLKLASEASWVSLKALENRYDRSIKCHDTEW